MATELPHVFLMRGEISVPDLEKLIERTNENILIWHKRSGVYSIQAFPSVRIAWDNQQASEAVVGRNIRGVRIGMDPNTRNWHFVRLSDHYQNKFYVDLTSPSELQASAQTLYQTAMLQLAKRLGIDIPDEHSLPEYAESLFR